MTMPALNPNTTIRSEWVPHITAKDLKKTVNAEALLLALQHTITQYEKNIAAKSNEIERLQANSRTKPTISDPKQAFDSLTPDQKTEAIQAWLKQTNAKEGHAWATATHNEQIFEQTQTLLNQAQQSGDISERAHQILTAALNKRRKLAL